MIDFEQPVDATVAAAIADAIAPFREALDISIARVVPEESHSGEPVIRVWLDIGVGDAETKFPLIHEADDAIVEAVRSTGERRFVLFRHDFGNAAGSSRH